MLRPRAHWLLVPALACSSAETVAPEPELAPEAQPEAISEPEPEDVEPEPEPDPTPRLPNGEAIVPCQEPAPEGMACVPGGPFVRGSDEGADNTRPAEEVHLQTFYMDIDEVTNAAWKACRAAGDCPRGGPLYNDFSRADQPIVGPSWFGAKAFCEAAGKHLPTEAQWEKAARGPEGALHPWGDEPATCELAVIKDKSGRSCGVKKKKEHPDKGRTFVVGTRPPGVYGLRDMMGNAWEWVADWASESYEACGEDCRGVDPKGPCAGAEECPGHDEKVVRGGSWYWPASHATGVYRRTHVPANPIKNFHHFGFRCAASVEEASKLPQPSSADAAASEAAAEGEGSPSR